MPRLLSKTLPLPLGKNDHSDNEKSIEMKWNRPYLPEMGCWQYWNTNKSDLFNMEMKRLMTRTSIGPSKWIQCFLVWVLFNAFETKRRYFGRSPTVFLSMLWCLFVLLYAANLDRNGQLSVIRNNTFVSSMHHFYRNDRE